MWETTPTNNPSLTCSNHKMECPACVFNHNDGDTTSKFTLKPLKHASLYRGKIISLSFLCKRMQLTPVTIVHFRRWSIIDQL